MRFNKGGLGSLEISDEKFWKSFFAAIICYPGAYFLSTLQETEITTTLDPFAVLLIDTLFYLISWLVYPVFMHSLLVLHNKQKNYRLFIISYNWIQVWQIAFLVCLQALILNGLLPTSLAGFLGLFGMLYILASQAYMTKITIETNWFSAAAFVFFNVLLALSIYKLNTNIIAS
ncbi:MAG: hypothetical protein V7776_03570 [Halopseudomonas aestusnigri]